MVWGRGFVGLWCGLGLCSLDVSESLAESSGAVGHLLGDCPGHLDCTDRILEFVLGSEEIQLGFLWNFCGRYSFSVVCVGPDSFHCLWQFY